MKILHVIPNLFQGGAEYQLTELVRVLRKDPSIEQEVLCLYSERSMNLLGHYDSIRQMGIPLRCCYDEVITGLKVVPKIRREIRRAQPDVIQAFLAANNYCLLANLGLPSKLFCGIRNAQLPEGSESILHRMLHRSVSGYIANSKKTMQQYAQAIRLPAAKAHTIYNGLHPERFLPNRSRLDVRAELGLPESARVIISVGNMHFPVKGHRELIAAFSEVAAIRGNDYLLLVGDGKLRQDFTAQVQAAGIENRVVFAGMRKDVPDLLHASDLYISASLSEGFSNSIAEALIANLPAIVTDVGGSAEIVRDGKDGLVVPSHSPEKLREAMLREFAPLPEEGRRRIRELIDINRLGREYKELYQCAFSGC